MLAAAVFERLAQTLHIFASSCPASQAQTARGAPVRIPGLSIVEGLLPRAIPFRGAFQD
jgi:hypothetical protein